jgi:hypothetical protein
MPVEVRNYYLMTLSWTHYIASNDYMIINNYLERPWIQAVMFHFKIFPSTSAEDWTKPRTTWANIVGLTTEIRTDSFLNIYHLNLFALVVSYCCPLIMPCMTQCHSVRNVMTDGAVHPPPVRLHGLVLNYLIKHSDNFAFFTLMN